ncbi:hypothetical protein C3F09_09945 [candidate division GN15 bacterium]|uniref:DUF5683 domain-containing protein n=1 Tax=candidate division GN15 bacterium TaxID=2072418 RepID=A0A855WX83_9BACT|nr:MAG: hypothetical protein C3F09_09945 [candidate division GN15 bacterium]
MKNKICVVVSILSLGLLCGVSRAGAEIKLSESQIDRHWRLAQLKSGPLYSSNYAVAALADTSFNEGKATADELVRPKSPAKAFALSMLIPGLGQYYNGSKLKAAAFLGIEATAWFFELKWHSDGNQLTGDFEAFQEAHWSEGHYSQYLQDVYGYSDDDSINATEISHHLPDTRTQQYYEMTGKYDQFSWGWDDATLNGHGFQYYADTGAFVRAVYPDVPTSLNRNQYETMRYNANQKFSDARKMIMLALGNRLVSAFEAFISAKRSHNAKPAGGEGTGNPEFSHWKFSGRVKSVHARYDTPYLKVTYGF